MLFAFGHPHKTHRHSDHQAGDWGSGGHLLQQQGVPALPASQLDELSRRLEGGAPGGAADLAGGWQLNWKGAELVLQQRAAER